MKASDLAREYAKAYIHFLFEKDISISSRDAYSLFRYTIGMMYGVRSGELKPIIVMNYEECRETLQVIKEKYKVVEDGLVDSIIEYSCVYALIAIQYCAGNIRVGNRIS